MAWMFAAPARPASGEEPDLMQTLIAQDATLNDNLTPIEARWRRNAQGRALELGFGVEKMLSPSLALEIGGQWDSMSPRSGSAAAAFGNVDLAIKYVFLKRENLQLAIAPQLSFPTSSHILDEPKNVQTGGFLTWGGRLGGLKLPVYLTAIELQGDLGYSHSFGNTGADEVFFDRSSTIRCRTSTIQLRHGYLGQSKTCVCSPS